MSDSDEQLHQKATKLHVKYSDDLTPDFAIEILSFRTLREDIKIKKSTKDMADFCLLEILSVLDHYRCTVYLLFLTLLVTVA